MQPCLMHSYHGDQRSWFYLTYICAVAYVHKHVLSACQQHYSVSVVRTLRTLTGDKQAESWSFCCNMQQVRTSGRPFPASPAAMPEGACKLPHKTHDVIMLMLTVAPTCPLSKHSAIFLIMQANYHQMCCPILQPLNIHSWMLNKCLAVH